MAKAIMLSIIPKYVSMILNKTKIIEVRKRFPLNYRGWVYIYCTKEDNLFKSYIRMGYYTNRSSADDIEYNGKGKVVARFYCDNVEEIEHYCCDDIYEGYHRENYGTKTLIKEELLKCSCLRECELVSYLSYNKNGELYGYAIHISQLEIFDKPKELSEFKSYKKNIVNTKINGMVFETELDNSLTKAPQSMMYIEVEE